jgi:hypothetical protein
MPEVRSGQVIAVRSVRQTSSDRYSAFGLRAALRALENDPLDARAELDNGSLVAPLLHGDFAAGADDLGHGVALNGHDFGSG